MVHVCTFNAGNGPMNEKCFTNCIKRYNHNNDDFNRQSIDILRKPFGMHNSLIYLG